MADLSIQELGFGKRDRKRFIRVEFLLNREDPLWVPPLLLDRLKGIYLEQGVSANLFEAVAAVQP